MNYKDFAEQIIALQNADLQLRDELMRDGQLFDGYNKQMEKLHNENAEVLKRIIETIGYPTIDKVGKQANDACWLVIQHSIGQPAFMKECAVLLEKAVHENKADPKQLAYLTDRIAVLEGRPQFYGTNFDWDEKGELSPRPVYGINKVDQRRKSIGLNSLEEQTKIIRQQAIEEGQEPPADINERKKLYNAWRKNVGWTI